MKKQTLFLILLISLLGLRQVKADTIHIQLPVSANYNSCEDTLSFNTFVVHKHPMMTGTPMWFIDGIPVGNGDSVVYIPTSVGLKDVSCLWNSITFGVGINLFAAPPAHANINLYSSSTGHINATKDTVWMCGGPVNIGAFGIVGSHATYQQWTGPNNFSDGNAGITVSTPGTYVWERGNPCGVTRDTVRVISLPTTLPAWPADTTFCNVPVSLNLGAGPGWKTYNWSTGGTAPNLQINTAGSYSVTVSNICTTQSKTVQVHNHFYPLPDIAQFNMATPFCADSIVVLNPAPGFTYDTYNWTWGTTGSSNNSSLSISGLTTGTNFYNVTVTKGVCSASASELFTFFEAPASIKICVVTVDTNGQVKVMWEKDEVVDSYNIYRLTSSGYQLVANIPYNQPNFWYDLSVNPTTSAYRYKVSANHIICKNEGPQGDFHGSIKITSSPATNGGVNLTITDPYIDGSGQFIPNSYYILIDSTNNGNYSIIDSIPAVFNSYHIQNPVVGSTYALAVLLPWNCNASKSTGLLAISNKSSVMVGIEQWNKKNNEIAVYPNPSRNIINIVTEFDEFELSLYNLYGQLVQQWTNNKIIDVSNLPTGTYMLHISNTNGKTVKKILIIDN